MEARQVSMEPWDYTLYEASDGSLIVKVVFIEGDRKVDVGRFFRIDPLDRSGDVSLALRSLSASIRDQYPDERHTELEKSTLTIVR